jgi:hypothetical protein
MSVRERISSYLSLEVFKQRAKSYGSEAVDRKLPEGIVIMFTLNKDGQDHSQFLPIEYLEADRYGADALRDLLRERGHVGLITYERHRSSDQWVLAVVPADEQLRVKTYSLDVDRPPLSTAQGSSAGVSPVRWLRQGYVSHLGRLGGAARSAQPAVSGHAQPAL